MFIHLIGVTLATMKTHTHTHSNAEIEFIRFSLLHNFIVTPNIQLNYSHHQIPIFIPSAWFFSTLCMCVCVCGVFVEVVCCRYFDTQLHNDRTVRLRCLAFVVELFTTNLLPGNCFSIYLVLMKHKDWDGEKENKPSTIILAYKCYTAHTF